MFNLTPAALQQLAAGTPPYCERQITTTRSNGKTKQRTVQEPRRELRTFHERAKRLLSKIEPPNFLFCPVKQRSYVGNAAAHIGAAEVRTVDIKDYFTATPSRRVYWFFNDVMRCSPDVAAILAHLLTVSGHIATGSPVSPILSFYSFYDMWRDIGALAAEHSCKITVYIDDLTVSGAIVPEHLMWKIRRRIHRSGLRYHKERRFTGRFAEVTGVVIRDGKTVLPNRQHLRAHKLRVEIKLLPESEERETLQRTLVGLHAQKRQVEAPI